MIEGRCIHHPGPANSLRVGPGRTCRDHQWNRAHEASEPECGDRAAARGPGAHRRGSRPFPMIRRRHAYRRRSGAEALKAAAAPCWRQRGRRSSSSSRATRVGRRCAARPRCELQPVGEARRRAPSHCTCQSLSAHCGTAAGGQAGHAGGTSTNQSCAFALAGAQQSGSIQQPWRTLAT